MIACDFLGAQQKLLGHGLSLGHGGIVRDGVDSWQLTQSATEMLLGLQQSFLALGMWLPARCTGLEALGCWKEQWGHSFDQEYRKLAAFEEDDIWIQK